MRRVAFTTLSLIAVGLAISSPAHADLVNGSFEDGTYTFGGDGGDSLPAGSAAITGWTTFAAELAVIENTNTFGLSTPYGNIFLDLTGYHDSAPYGGVEQSITTVIGQSYTLTLYLGVNNTSGDNAYGPVSVQVMAGTDSTTLTANPAGDGMIWTPETWQFTADSTTTNVMIQGESTASGHFIGLDNLSVSPSVVPEPTSLFMLSIGVIGIMSYAHRSAVKKSKRGHRKSKRGHR
jgi:hypothetical protein